LAWVEAQRLGSGLGPLSMLRAIGFGLCVVVGVGIGLGWSKCLRNWELSCTRSK